MDIAAGENRLTAQWAFSGRLKLMDRQRQCGGCLTPLPISSGPNRPITIAAAASAPSTCMITNAGTWLIAMPANVVVKPRASVTAGFANDVEDVNQYAAVIVRPTNQGTACGAYRTPPRIVTTSVKVATNSPSHCPAPLRAVVPTARGARSNMRCARTVPRMPPTHCEIM
jgi:hypothetical protein